MEPDLVKSWSAFVNILKCYGNPETFLNPPCSKKDIKNLEFELEFPVPASLLFLLQQNNGQRYEKKGIFKSVCLWDVYERHVFLSGEDIPIAYKYFIKDEILLEEFGKEDIPFAVVGTAKSYKATYTINHKTEEISVIQTDYYDPLMPSEWQVSRLERGKNLVEFIQNQIRMYR